MYNHAIDVAFEVISENENFPTREEIMKGLEKRIASLRTQSDDAFLDSFDVYDTFDINE